MPGKKQTKNLADARKKLTKNLADATKRQKIISPMPVRKRPEGETQAATHVARRARLGMRHSSKAHLLRQLFQGPCVDF